MCSKQCKAMHHVIHLSCHVACLQGSPPTKFSVQCWEQRFTMHSMSLMTFTQTHDTLSVSHCLNAAITSDPGLPCLRLFQGRQKLVILMKAPVQSRSSQKCLSRMSSAAPQV